MAKRYSTEEVERALHVLALEAGNTGVASRKLAIPDVTLRHWRLDTHRERYEAIRTRLEERLDRELAEDMSALARQRVEALRQLGDRINDRNSAENLKDLASADRNLATSLGILSQNNRIIREKPTQVIETRSAEDSWKALEALGVVIEGTATEVELKQIEGGDGLAVGREATSPIRAPEGPAPPTA